MFLSLSFNDRYLCRLKPAINCGNVLTPNCLKRIEFRHNRSGNLFFDLNGLSSWRSIAYRRSSHHVTELVIQPNRKIKRILFAFAFSLIQRLFNFV